MKKRAFSSSFLILGKVQKNISYFYVLMLFKNKDIQQFIITYNFNKYQEKETKK